MIDWSSCMSSNAATFVASVIGLYARFISFCVKSRMHPRTQGNWGTNFEIELLSSQSFVGCRGSIFVCLSHSINETRVWMDCKVITNSLLGGSFEPVFVSYWFSHTPWCGGSCFCLLRGLPLCLSGALTMIHDGSRVALVDSVLLFLGVWIFVECWRKLCFSWKVPPQFQSSLVVLAQLLSIVWFTTLFRVQQCWVIALSFGSDSQGVGGPSTGFDVLVWLERRCDACEVVVETDVWYPSKWQPSPIPMGGLRCLA